MDFLDDIKTTASDVGKTVSRYANTAYTASKKKLTVIDLKTKLNEAYKELGKLCFQDGKTGEDLSESIANKKEEIKSIIDKINENL